MAEPVSKREFLKKAAIGSIALASLPTLGGALAAPASAHEEDEGADKVRWDIISLDHAPPNATISAGGVAFASAQNPSTPTIKLTGSGTFVARSGSGESRRAKGGGTWEAFGAGVSPGSGTYRVRRVVNWQFANFQAQTPPFIDNIGNTNERANGVAFLTIKYSDGSRGVLGILCHGPGAPNGIHEGVIATRGFVTYVDSHGPTAPFSDANRTISTSGKRTKRTTTEGARNRSTGGFVARHTSRCAPCSTKR